MDTFTVNVRVEAAACGTISSTVPSVSRPTVSISSFNLSPTSIWLSSDSLTTASSRRSLGSYMSMRSLPGTAMSPGSTILSMMVPDAGASILA